MIFRPLSRGPPGVRHSRLTPHVKTPKPKQGELTIMATLEDLQQQARNAQRRLNNARKRADENLGKRLRELVTGEDSLNREAQVERAESLLDELFAERSKQHTEQSEERQERNEDSDGPGYEGNGQYS